MQSTGEERGMETAIVVLGSVKAVAMVLDLVEMVMDWVEMVTVGLGFERVETF